MLGLVHAIYGNGRGKTTSAIGLAIRAFGAGNDVSFVQFMKSGDSSEVNILKSVGVSYFCSGVHELVEEGVSEIQMTHARLAYEQALARVKQPGMLVCDEILTAEFFGELTIAQIVKLIEVRGTETELVLTGIHGYPEIIRRADYCSDICLVKHPYVEGIEARRGIEY